MMVFLKTTFAVVTFGGSISIKRIFSQFCRRIVKGRGPGMSRVRVFCYLKLTIKVLMFFGRVKGGGVASSPAPVRIRVQGCRRSISVTFVRGTKEGKRRRSIS